MHRLFGAYLRTHPIMMKSTIAGILHVTAESLNQVEKGDFVAERIIGYCSLGIFNAPIVHFWYLHISKRWISPYKCIIADQLLCAPLMLLIYIATMKLIDCKCWNKSKSFVYDNYCMLLLKNWLFWVPANYINFRWVQLPLRTIYGNALGLLWGVYLTHKVN